MKYVFSFRERSKLKMQSIADIEVKHKSIEDIEVKQRKGVVLLTRKYFNHNKN
jgi:mannitol-specific phosphotransferase system IIBC component